MGDEMTWDDLEKSLSFGACCACSSPHSARNVLMLDIKAPVPGTGHGCVFCCTPPDGAIAVLSDDCAARCQAGQVVQVREVVFGHLTGGARVPYPEKPEPFQAHTQPRDAHSLGFGARA